MEPSIAERPPPDPGRFDSRRPNRDSRHGPRPGARRRKPLQLSIVVPVFNAERTVGPLCRALVAELGAEHELDLVLVDDHSADGSAAACLAAREEHPGVITFVQLARNFGEHNAVMAGFRHVRGEVVVTIDDDLQNPPSEVRRLLAALEEGHDVVYGRFRTRRDPWFRRAASRLHGVLVRALLKKPGEIDLTSFRAMRRFVVDEVLRYEGPHPYVDAILLRATARVGAVEVAHAPRREARSNYTLRKLLALWGNAVIGYSLIPLRVFGALGLVLAVVGALHGGLLLRADFLDGDRGVGAEEVLATTFFLRGLQFMATALVGEYVGRILLHLNRDPQFVVRSVVPAQPRPAAARPGAPGGAGGGA